ncbi:DNA mismatch repair protein MLH3 isoform X1 [Vicia villosa]|uniref:DNA mismatch repair protein MLH3 isoform X1 n=1 Tax=Vicia villosa TaxID=3911 RepID=UPI00273BC591|nr:DNA mismatch repair protein MLH3 isoform X1 [Vicia villosa]
MATIRPLPESVRSSIRSGISLFDFTRIVEELVFNSLDARATKVSVFVNVGNCFLKVVDDGDGITRDGLELVGERYATSKFLNLADLNTTSENFGFRGEALASISEVSLLEIVTRASGRPNGYKKVLKGCKCLYLGIDDDRKEVGTTVIVCEIFYNQPVRRKHIESSPNKVLQSIKKCVMRLALVCPNISFKVVDIEREDELFCSHSAASPLSLVTAGFGVEVTNSLHELEVENNIIKLTGYISDPCNTLDMKALQYLYINSQFVCKGPIHKLLSQLAIRFEHRNSWSADNECKNKKRDRSQPCPAYILNLRCPRSLYVLSFGPSKTYVEFKDWTPILNFIEKVIKHFWEGSIAYGDSINKATYTVQKDQQEKVDLDVNTISAEADISKFGNQNRKGCLDLFFSTSDKLTEDDNHECKREDVRTNVGYLHRRTEMFKDKQNMGGLHCWTGYSGNLLDVSYAKSMVTTKKKNNNFLTYDNNDLLQGVYFSDGMRPAVENLYDNIPFYATSSSHGRKLDKVDASVLCESFEGDSIYDSYGFGYDVEIDGDFQKPFLKSCSTQKGSILHEKALLVNNEPELQTFSFWSKQNLGGDCFIGKDLNALPCVEVAKKLKMSEDSDFLLRAQSKENCRPSVSWYSATQIGNSSSGDQLPNSERHPVYQSPSPKATALGVYHTNDISDLQRASRCYERTHHTQNFYDEEIGNNFSYNLEGASKYCKRIHRTHVFDDEEKEYNFSYDMSRHANQQTCTSSFANSGFSFDGAVDFNEILNRLVDWPDFSDSYFPKRSDILNEETNLLLTESYVGNCTRPNISNGKRDRFRHPVLEKTHVRSKRSFSAPPFHRSKRRFFSLNQLPDMIAERYTGQASQPTTNLLEASDFKYSQHPSGAFHPSNEDLLQDLKTNEKRSSEFLGAPQIDDIAKTDGFESFNVQQNDQFRELISREVQDPIDYGNKWRSHSPQTQKNDKLIDIGNQNNILDISSGFLHLAGNSLIPETISKKCLEDAKVLHQVDKKFIPIMAGKTLAVIDQHAADERIRLEDLRQKVLSGEAKAITYLDAEQELVLPEMGYQLLNSYSEQIKDWGWICKIHTQNSDSFRRNLDILNKQQMTITLVAVPSILGANLNDVDLLEFLQQLAETDGSSTMPPSVVRLLNSKACRGAIMFGDSLLPSECSLLVEELKHTSLCFQCAHGRPTTVPLVNLEALHDQIAQFGLMNEGSSNDKWHGLQRHKVCLERAVQRLSSARS